MKLYVHSVVNVISERSRFNNMSTILERSLSGKSLYFDVDTTKSVLALKKQAGAKLFDSMGRVNIAYQSMTFNPSLPNVKKWVGVLLTAMSNVISSHCIKIRLLACSRF
jgi:hypothetical protein